MDAVQVEERAGRRRELAGLHSLTAFPLAQGAVRNFIARMALGGELRVRVVTGEDVFVSREDLHAVAYDNVNTERREEAKKRLAVAVETHVAYGERKPHLMFPAWRMRPPLYTRDLMRLL